MNRRRFGVNLLSTPEYYLFGEEEARKVYYNLCEYLKYKYKNTDYDYSILVGLSKVDGKSVLSKVKSNGIGRHRNIFVPKNEKKGIKYVNWHFHIMVCGAPLGIESLVPWPILLAALFGSIGLTVLFGINHKYCKYHKYEGKFVEETIESDDNIVDVRTTFGETTKYINNKQLERINVSCSFGAAKIYLDNAELKDDKAIMNLDISFAGVELYVPKGWKIINNADISLGGIDEKNDNRATSDKTLTLTGKVSLAGIEIIYI